MNYNKYNQEYINKLNNIENNFNTNNIKDYIELLKLIYQIYCNENIFIVIDLNVKFQLNNLLNFLIRNNQWFIDFNANDQFQYLRSFIIYINKEINLYNNFYVNKNIKQSIEKFLQIDKKVSQKYSNVFECINNEFSNDNIKQFFESYNIDFSKQYLNINETIIPNFSLIKKNKMIDHYYEFYHLLFKIYAPLLYYGTSFQEGYEYSISEKDIIFDCGGNMGLFALYCASKGATVYCFEPMSYIRDFLYESKKLYPDLIHIIPYGVSNKEENCYFQQGYNPGASKNIEFSNLQTSPEIYKEKCKIITLDNFSTQNNIIPTFIKADIEGAEKNMLLGAKNILQNYKPVLHICLNHRDIDQIILPLTIYQLNSNYSFYPFLEGDAQSKFILCK